MSEEVEAEEEQGKLMSTNTKGQGSQSNRNYNRGVTNYNGQQTRDYNREYRSRGRGGLFYNQGRGREEILITLESRAIVAIRMDNLLRIVQIAC